jgi:hypothetical protein
MVHRSHPGLGLDHIRGGRSVKAGSAAGLGGLVVLLATGAAMCPTTASAGQPPPPTDHGRLGAYQEPAPRAQQEKHAAKFVNQILEHTGARVRVSKAELRPGVELSPTRPSPRALSPRRSLPRATPAKKRQPKLKPKPKPRPRLPVARAPAIDLGPAERAGVSTPSNPRVPGELLGLVLAGVLVVIGAGLEVGQRTRAGSRRARR